MVLAGGRGTRIAQLYPDVPKPLIPAAGRPFLHWVTAWLIGQGCRHIVYSTGYKGDQIEDWARSLGAIPEVTLQTSREHQELGTAGGLINSLPLCGEWIVVLNGDSLLFTELPAMLDSLVASGADAALAGLQVPDASRFGTLRVDAAGFLQEFAEKTPGAGLINGGVYVFRRADLLAFPERTKLSLETDVIPQMLGSGKRISVYRTANAAFLDIGTPASVVQAGDFVQANAQFFADI